MEKQVSQQQFINDAKGAIHRIKQLEVDPNWQKFSDTPCAMYKMGIDSRLASRGECIVNFPFEEVYEFLFNILNSHKDIDPMLKQQKILFEVPGYVRVFYMHFSAFWPVDDRDFVMAEGILNQGNKKIYLASKSCNYPYPELKGVIRAQLYIGGYIIQKIDNKKTKVIYISDADIKGMIPGPIKNILSKSQGEVASKIQPAMTKKKSK